MKKRNYSKKELKGLAQRLSKLIKSGAKQSETEVRILVYRIKQILGSFGLRKRQVRRILGTTAVFLGLGFSQTVHAQAAFATPVSNPFGLSAAYLIATPVQADLDNDGDLDILVAEYYGNFKYYQNTGTATAPAFAAPVQNPFGLTAVLSYLPGFALADLDNDGDLDLMAYEYNTNTYNADIKYFQNTGTAAAPTFAAPTTNPFGINSATYFKAPNLVDIDNDGDFDLFTLEYNATSYIVEHKYQENIGTAAAPNFGPVQTNPFGLSFPSTSNAGLVDFGDLDGDGDLDMIFGEFGGNGDFRYYQNTGTASAPNFINSLVNPFGLVATNAASTYNKINSPVLLDLDGDGDLDILTGEYGGNLVYFENVFTNSGPLNIFNVTIGSPSCSPGGDGTITALAGGGVGPIIYKIGTDSNTTGSFSNFSPGTYTLRVRDSVNTIIDSTITITAPTGPSWDSLNSFVSNVSCNGLNDGLIFMAGSGGTTPYTYQLLPGFATPTTNNLYNNLSPNNYTAIITDANNCIDSTSISITQPAAINFTIDSTTNLTCFGSNDGAIYTTASGGNGGFNYTITPNAGLQINPGDFTNLPPGTYTVNVMDANQCTASIQQTITQPANTIVITINSVTNVSCFGGNDGEICLSAAGGAAPYSYNPALTAGCLPNLSAGNYSITATDANGCTNSTNQNISQAPQLNLSVSSTQNASSGTAADGSITSVASGGTPPISYGIVPNMGTLTPPGTFTGLSAGSYTITATDANNCTITTAATVGANWPIAVNDIEKHNIKVYPNPVSDILKLESDIEILKISVLDVTGKILSEIKNPKETISLQEIPSGLYILKISLKNEETVYTRISKQ